MGTATAKAEGNRFDTPYAGCRLGCRRPQEGISLSGGLPMYSDTVVTRTGLPVPTSAATYALFRTTTIIHKWTTSFPRYRKYAAVLNIRQELENIFSLFPIDGEVRSNY